MPEGFMKDSPERGGEFKVVLLDHTFDIDAPSDREGEPCDLVVCTWWIEPGRQARIAAALQAPCVGLADIVKSEMLWGKRVHGLVGPFCAGGPRIEGVPWRFYLEEALYREEFADVLMQEVGSFVRERAPAPGSPAVLIDVWGSAETYGRVRRALGETAGWTIGHAPTGDGPDPGRRRLWARLIRKVRDGVLRESPLRVLGEAAESIDRRYALRSFAGSLLPRSRGNGAGILFFSSYENNTRTMAPFETIMPGDVSWVVGNESARSALPRGARWSALWRYSHAESQRHDSHQPQEPDVDVPPVVEETRTWRSWAASERRLLENMTRCWEACLKETSPRLVVLASQWGLDGWFARLASARGIPVVQIMHGLLGGWLHTKTRIFADLMVVPGEYWRDLWPETEREKILACVPGAGGGAPAAGRKRARRITYFSWPLDLIEEYNDAELFEGITTILERCARDGCEIAVRNHPLERPSAFVDRWNRRRGVPESSIRIDNRRPVGEVLADTGVAVMYRSTVMWDCIAAGVPTVMPGWIDAGWGTNLGRSAGVALARDFGEMETTVRAWVGEPPPIDPEACARFILPAGSGVESVKRKLESLAVRRP
jgi:hypothetical protein